MINLAANTLAVSLCPEEAVCYLAGIYTTLAVFDPTNIVQTYRGRILIHSLGFPDEPELKPLCHQILEEFGFDEDTFPALSIQGLATVSDVFLYNEDKFVADREAHGHDMSLLSYQADAEKIGYNTWGVKLSDTYFLERPVCDVMPPSYEVISNCLWLPQGPEHLADFNAALQRDRTA